MNSSKRIAGWAAATVALLSAAIGAVGAVQRRDATAGGYVIRGRVADPLQLRPADAVLMLGRQSGESFRRTDQDRR
jgi:hypothetical protein